MKKILYPSWAWGKTHSPDTLAKLSELKKGTNLNKSPEFLEQMYKDKRGDKNPMYGKTRSPETLAKISKKVYVYEVNGSEKTFLKVYNGIVEAKKDLHMGYDTLKNCCETNRVFKGKIYSYDPLIK